jgi:hypothetical protein
LICSINSVAWEANYVGEEVTGNIKVDTDEANEFKIKLTVKNDTGLVGNVELKATVTFTDHLTNTTFTHEAKMEILAEPFTFGCGLTCREECVGDDPDDKVFKTVVDLDAIAGEGLVVKPGEGPCGCPKLEVVQEFGCGLIEKEFCIPDSEETEQRWSVDVGGLTGVGLTVDCKKDPCGCDKFAINLRDRFESTYVYPDPDLPGENTGLTLRALKQSTSDVTAFFSPGVVKVQSHVSSSQQIYLELYHIDKDQPDDVRLHLGLPLTVVGGAASFLNFYISNYYRQSGWNYLGKPDPGLWFTLVAESQGDVVLGGGTLTDGKRWHQSTYGSSSIDESIKQITHSVPVATPTCDNNRVIYTVYVSTSSAVPNPIVPSGTFVKVLEVTADYVRNRDPSYHRRANTYFANSIYKSSEYDVNLEPAAIASRLGDTYTARLRQFDAPTKTQLAAGALHAGNPIGGYTLVSLPGDTIPHQETPNTPPRLTAKTLIPIGCGLEAKYLNQEQESLGELGFRRIQVDVEALAGDGLKQTDVVPPEDVYAPFGCSKLEAHLGCGLKFEDEKDPPEGQSPRKVIAVDLDAIAGTGLTVELGEEGDCPTLKLDTEYEAGCGIKVSNDILLEKDIISIDFPSIATSGEYTWNEASCPTLQVLDGCSTAGGFGATVGVLGLQGLTYYQEPEDPYDCPYLFSQVKLPYNCTFKVEGRNLGVNLDIFGKGLNVALDPDDCPKIELCVDDGTSSLLTEHILGTGLTEISDGQVTKAIVYGVVEHEASESEDDCGRLITKNYLPVGCHFNVASNFLKLDLTKLAGTGLSVDNSTDCPKLKADGVELTPGCGIRIDTENNISVNLGDIAFSGIYTWDQDDCPLPEVLTGCSTGSGLQGTSGLAQLQGPVLYDTTYEGCPQLFSKANLPYNCSLEVDYGNLGINYGIFGKGLTTLETESGCTQVNLCVEDGTSPITSIEGTTLDASGSAAVVYGEVNYQQPDPYEGGCGKLITKSVLPVGCHFDLENGKLELDLSSLAGAGLSLTDDECPKLKVDFSESSCDIASLLGLCAAPAVTPTTNDFVLGLRPGEDGTCCIVKFLITECPTDEPPVDPEPGPTP